MNRPRSELCRVFRRDVLQGLESVRDRNDPRRTTEPPEGISGVVFAITAPIKFTFSYAIEMGVDPPVHKRLLFVELVDFMDEFTIRAHARLARARYRTKVDFGAVVGSEVDGRGRGLRPGRGAEYMCMRVVRRGAQERAVGVFAAVSFVL